MNICVCVKQVPDTNVVRIDPVTHTLIRKGVPSIVNPFDELALESAVRLREKHGGQVIVVSMGPEQAKAAIRSCLAAGGDKGYLVSDRLFGGADTFSTSYILSEAIREIENRESCAFDLVLCGKQAIDGDTAQVGPELATHLDMPQITYAMDISFRNGEFTVKRETETGYDILASAAPLLVTVSGISGEMRYPTIASKRKARQAEIIVISSGDLPGLDLSRCGLKGSPTKVKKIYTPIREKICRKIEGESAGRKVQNLLDSLAARNII